MTRRPMWMPACFACLLLACAAFADKPTDKPSPKALEALDQVIVFNFKDTPLPEALEELLAKTPLKSRVDAAAMLNNADLSDITFKSSRLTLREALDKLIEMSVREKPLDPIEWIAYGDTVHVSTSHIIHGLRNQTRSYDIRFLLARAVDPPPQAPAEIKPKAEAKPQPDAKPVDGDKRRLEFANTREALIEALIHRVTDEVGKPSLWVQNGGESKSIREANGSLFVKAGPEDHDKIVAIIQEEERLAALAVDLDVRMYAGRRQDLDRLLAEHAAGRTSLNAAQAAALLQAIDDSGAQPPGKDRGPIALVGLARLSIANASRAQAAVPPHNVPAAKAGQPPHESSPFTLDIEPTLASDRRAAMLALRVEWPHPAPPASAPSAAPMAPASLRTTVAVSIDGGLALSAPMLGDPDRHWILILRPRVAPPLDR